MALQLIQDVDLNRKKVLVRCDFNVPLENGKITDTTRVDLVIPTIKLLLENGADKIILMSHLGRPKGKPSADLSLEPVADYLAQKLNQEVVLTESAIKSGVKELLGLSKIKIVLLENLRFHSEEENNDSDFARQLASYADVYVNEAFGAAHRKHASVHSIIQFFPRSTYAGLLMQKEVSSLSKIIESPQKPFVAVVGGAKVSDKIKTLEKLLISVDHILIGGAMAYPFLKAKGYTVGKSLCSEEDQKLASSILKQDKAGKIKLPQDHITSLSFGGEAIECPAQNIAENEMGLDIGQKTIEYYSEFLSSAKTVFWNGPMGLFENKNFSNGTFEICKTIAKLNDCFTLVGGGDSVSAVMQSGLADEFSHVSSGGGASLEFIEKGQLPGVQALKFGV